MDKSRLLEIYSLLNSKMTRITVAVNFPFMTAIVSLSDSLFKYGNVQYTSCLKKKIVFVIANSIMNRF